MAEPPPDADPVPPVAVPVPAGPAVVAPPVAPPPPPPPLSAEAIGAAVEVHLACPDEPDAPWGMRLQQSGTGAVTVVHLEPWRCDELQEGDVVLAVNWAVADEEGAQLVDGKWLNVQSDVALLQEKLVALRLQAQDAVLLVSRPAAPQQEAQGSTTS